jgi:hypothetical protein
MIAGIDSGLSGALALYDDTAVVALIDMPTFEIIRGKTKRCDLDGQAVCAWLREHEQAHAYIEAAQAIPRQSSLCHRTAAGDRAAAIGSRSVSS